MDTSEEPLEGYGYRDTERAYVQKRRRDSSCERTTDKRPRSQSDNDCLAVMADNPDNVAAQHSLDRKSHPTRGVSSDWLPTVYSLVFLALVCILHGAI